MSSAKNLRKRPAKKLAKAKRPYPGLRHYEDGQEVLFAGRTIEIERCADMLKDSRVLVLHGRTGCGKSSFLRAGVKPFLARTNSPINFAQARDGFSVIRSTADPLRAFGAALLEVADTFTSPAAAKKTKRSFGKLASDVNPERIRTAFPDDDAFRESVMTSADAAFNALNTLARAMQTPPIFVIDQAEEVFTLEPRHAFDETDDEAANKARELDLRDAEYFRFIHKVASKDARTRLVVSLRTEYKGLFDDQIALHGHPGEDLKGFHLRDLDLTGLKAAILRPTLREGKDWDKIKRRLDLDDDTPAPGDATGALHITDRAATKLARDLLSDKVPTGGVLPTLQAACIRLWAQSSHARETRGEDYEIDSADLRRLGEIGNQVEEYLQEEIETACAGVDRWKKNLPETVRTWLGALRDFLVRVEADGRAVTKSLLYRDLAEEISNQLVGGLEKNLPHVRVALNALLEPMVGILKPDQSNILALGEDDRDIESGLGNITLGHDSLALALNKWSIASPRDNHKMMMRMGMATMHRLRDLREGQLFLNEDPPHRTTIVVPIDFSWDRQLPHFAQARGFAERLGISFESSDDLDARLSVKKKWNWDALRSATIAREESWGDERRKNGHNERVLIAAEFAAFPGAPPPESEAGVAKRKDPRTEYAWRWSDLLVSDLFVGNALVGPNKDFSDKMAEAMKIAEVEATAEKLSVSAAQRGASDHFVSELSGIVIEALEELLNKGGNVWCAGESGKQLLVLAAKICGRPDLADKIDNLESEGSLRTLDKAVYDVRDPLIEFLLKEKTGQDRFIVGSAATRAMARQCGFHTYFGAKEIAILAAKEMERRQRFDYEIKQGAKISSTVRKEEDARRKALPDLAEETQKIVSHTVWNVSVPASAWRQGLNRAFILRLASIGYFTSEYVRTSMDDFIGFIHEFVNKSLTDDTEGDGAMSGQRQMRYAIKQSIAECYTFLRFDEFGPAVFDLDSLYAYWSEHGNLQTRSVAGEIYNELVTLRQKTIEHYQVCAEAIAWMRYGKAYEPSDEDVSYAFRLKELAWNNYNIYNFYDSERYMSQAADSLRRCMEKDFSR
ncbi:MAG: hypothetical protein ABL871_04290 [Terricaulis sp.]